MDLHSLALCIIDTVNLLAWRPLRCSKPIRPFCKLTNLTLDYNLFNISRDALVFKIENVYTGEGGKHVYVPHSQIDSFLAE